MDIEKNTQEKDIQRFSKDAFLNSKEYSARKDLIMTLLDENSLYSKEEANKIIEKYLKGRVK